MTFPYETTAGLPTIAENYSQMLEYLRRLQELAAMNAHLLNTEDGHMDRLLAKGWLGTGELFKRMEHTITLMAQGRLQ